MKKFLIVWGEGYALEGNNVKEVHREAPEFFTEDNGFDGEQQDAIKALVVGQAITFWDLSGYVSIVRVD